MPKRTHDGLKKRCDCGSRKWAKCRHSWWINFHCNGHEHRLSLDVVARARGEKPPTSKADAAKWRDKLRMEIRGGHDPMGQAAQATATPSDVRLTFDDVVKNYRKQYVHVPTRRPRAAQMFEIHLNMLLRATVPGPNGVWLALKAKPIDAITKADVEAIRDERRRELASTVAPKTAEPSDAPPAADAAEDDRPLKKIRRPGAKAGEVGINRLLARFRHVFSWAIAEGYVNETPFKRGGVSVVKLEHRAETSRQRRLAPGEEARLLQHADDHLRALVTAALSTGCRLGELLGLQWAQVRRNEKNIPIALELPAGRTKTNQARVIPVGPRLRAELEMRRQDPAGNDHPATAYVFGNTCGEQITSVRESWALACQAAGIADLHFHDLRREFACRLLESSADLHDVRDFLGHANVTTTSTYLASTPVRLARALERLDPEPAKASEPSDAKDSPVAAELTPDSHTIHTNEAVDENSQSDGPAVIH